MRTSESPVAMVARRMQGTKVPRCSPFGKAARALWPRKTAAEFAYRGNVTERAAKYWLSGEREPNATIIAAVVNEITRRVD